MLDWLKAILGEAYTEDAEKKISAEIGKNFVARNDFNAKNDAIKHPLCTRQPLNENFLLKTPELWVTF